MRYLIVLLLTGCATTQGAWHMDGSNEQMFYQDRGFCVAQSAMAYNVRQQTLIFAGCMQGKGWEWRTIQ